MNSLEYQFRNGYITLTTLSNSKKNAAIKLSNYLNIHGLDIHDVLDVGCGNGDLIETVIDKLIITRNDVIKVVLIEPDKELLSEAKMKLGKFEKIMLSGVEKTIEQALESENWAQKFDLIIASHVFYYIKNIKKTIMNLYKLININGRLCLIARDVDSDTYKLRMLYRTYAGLDISSMVSGQFLINAIRDLGLHYSYESITSNVILPNTDVDELFLAMDENELSSNNAAWIIKLMGHSNSLLIPGGIHSKVKKIFEKRRDGNNIKLILKDNIIWIYS